MTSQSAKRYFLDIPGIKAPSLNYKMPSQNNRCAMMNQEISFDAHSQDSHVEKVARSYSSMSQVSNPYSKVKDKYQKYLQKVNSVNEKEYSQLTEHRRQYDRYIRLVNRPNAPPNFSRMVL